MANETTARIDEMVARRVCLAGPIGHNCGQPAVTTLLVGYGLEVDYCAEHAIEYFEGRPPPGRSSDAQRGSEASGVRS